MQEAKALMSKAKRVLSFIAAFRCRLGASANTVPRHQPGARAARRRVEQLALVVLVAAYLWRLRSRRLARAMTTDPSHALLKTGPWGSLAALA